MITFDTTKSSKKGKTMNKNSTQYQKKNKTYLWFYFHPLSGLNELVYHQSDSEPMDFPSCQNVPLN